MKVLMIPSGFKECLDAEEVAHAMGKGAARFAPTVETELLPMIDGGEGFAKAIVRLKQGEIIHKKVTGPTGKQITSHYGLYIEGKKRVAVIEMAAVAGLKLVPRNERNPLHTTTYGVGELIKDALNQGVDDILIGCGDSGTSDGGVGMAEALGAVFKGPDGKPMQVRCAKNIANVTKISLKKLDPRLQKVDIHVACNWKNILCGDKGVARIFGPQKGATPEQVEELAAALDHYAKLIKRATGLNLRHTPGSGASGGLGAGLVAFANATLHPRFEIIKQFINMEQKIKEANLIITAEGSLDYQTVDGKIPCEVAKIAKQYGIPVIAITGTIGKGAKSNYEAGIDAYVSIIQRPVSLEDAIRKAPRWIEESVEGILRQISIGAALGTIQPAPWKGTSMHGERTATI